MPVVSISSYKESNELPGMKLTVIVNCTARIMKVVSYTHEKVILRLPMQTIRPKILL